MGSGHRYINLFDISSHPGRNSSKPEAEAKIKNFGKTIMIDDQRESVALESCWTADEDFIVVIDINSPWVWIAEVSSSNKFLAEDFGFVNCSNTQVIRLDDRENREFRETRFTTGIF